MSWLSDTWKGIESSFDINKMKRDPLGSAAKLAAIYGVGSTVFGAIAPEMAGDVGDWMRKGFGFYDAPPASKAGSGYNLKGYADYKGPYSTATVRRGQIIGAGSRMGKPGFWERQIKGVGAFAARPFDLGINVDKWIKGDMSWSDVWGGEAPRLNELEKYRQLMGKGLSGEPAGRPEDRRQERKKVTHRDFQRGSPAAVTQISQARQGGMYKPGGISQALITGAITPEQLAMIRYGAGGVSAQERNIALADVGRIKTTLRSAV